MNVEVKRNAALGGLELYFDSKPEARIIDALKSAHYRWHRTKKCWFAKANEKTEQVAGDLAGGTIPESFEQEPVKVGAVAEPSFNYSGHGFERINYKEYGHDIVLISKVIKKELLRLYPGSVWSVTTSKYSMGQSLSITLMGSQYPAYRKVDDLLADMDARQQASRRINQYTVSVEDGWDAAIEKELRASVEYFDKTGRAQVNQYYIDEEVYLSPEVKAMMMTARNLANSFNFDDSDSQSDYFHTNFYYDLSIGAYNKPYTVKAVA